MASEEDELAKELKGCIYGGCDECRDWNGERWITLMVSDGSYVWIPHKLLFRYSKLVIHRMSLNALPFAIQRPGVYLHRCASEYIMSFLFIKN